MDSSSSPSGSGQASASRAKSVLALLVVLNILNIVDRNLISSFGSAITRDLQLSDSQFGLLTGLIFVFFYAVMGLFVGRLADIMHRPRLIAAGLLVWSALTVVSGSAKNFVQIGAARLFVGVGEACLTPAAISMLADLFPKARRGTASALYYLGVPLGAGASFIAAGVLGPILGWRNCFYLIGGLGLLLVPVLFFMRDPERGAQDSSDEAQPVRADNLISSLKQVSTIAKQSPALAWTMLGAIAMHLPIGSAQFVELWLVRERGFDPATITVIYGLMLVIVGTVGSVIGGFASDWYQSKYRGGRVRFLAIFLLCVAPFLLGYRLSEPGSLIFYLGMGGGILSLMAFYGPAFSTIQDLSPPHLRGVTTALLLLASNLLGLGLGAVLAGVLSDVFRSFDVVNPLTWSLIVIDILSALTIYSFWRASKHWDRQFGAPAAAASGGAA